VSRIKFLFLGDGQDRDRLASEVRALGLANHFVFRGVVRPESVCAPDLASWTWSFTCRCVKDWLELYRKRWRRAGQWWPMTVTCCRSVSQQSNRIFGQAGDLATLQDRILQLAQDPPLRARLGESGRELVRESFAVERMIDELHVLYRRLACHEPRCRRNG
jgi:glycosyltransferase involved in cell wall biosynthesis